MSENSIPVQENTPVPGTPPVEQVTSPPTEKLPPKKFCHNCGAEVGDERFCAKCGIDLTAPIGVNPLEAEALDASKNKVYAIISYFGILCVVPMFAAKDSPFARFHCNQGLVLFLANIMVSVLNTINGLALAKASELLYGLVSLLLSGVSICLTVFSIMGIVYACQGKKKALPLIENIKLVK